jgi:hypothetical protein
LVIKRTPKGNKKKGHLREREWKKVARTAVIKDPGEDMRKGHGDFK